MSHSVNVACRLLCESCIHGLILLAFALIASRLLRRSSAAIRCLVWQTAAGLMLLLPIISSILPGRNITVPALPGRIVSVFADPTPVQDQPIMAAAVDINVAAQAAIPQTLLNASSPTVSDRSSSEPVPASLRNLPSSLSALPLRLPSSLFVLLLWAGVMALLAFEVVIGHVRLHGLRRRCVAVEAGPIMDLTVEICTRLGIRRRITLLQTPHTMPMAWGWLSPVVLLPTEAIGWPTNRIELVLLHELAHIRRGDWPMQRFARVLCCLYWFHPMAWICLSQMKRAGEEACDDVVLSSGVQAPEYAAQLLEVVRMMRLNVPIHRGHDPASVAMAQPAHIHDRLRTILEPMRSRTGVRRSTVLAAAAATLCIVPLGSLHVFAQSTAPASSQPGTPDAASYNHKEQSTAATANAKSSADQEASRARELSAKLKQQAALIAKQQHEIATLRRAAEMARAESQDRALMLEKLKKQQAEISARSAEMNAANARLERDAEKLAAQRESLSKRLGAGSAEYAEAAKELSLREAEIDELAANLQRIKAMSSVGSAAASDLATARANLEHVQADLIKRRAELAGKAGDDVSAKAERLSDALAAAIAKLQSIGEQYSAGATTKAALDAAKSAVDKAKAELLKVREQLETLKAEQKETKKAGE